MGAAAPAIMVAATVASAAASGISSYSQSKREKEIATLENKQAKVMASEEALQVAKNFRGALSSQIAMATLRQGAGGSLATQFASQSMANYGQDVMSMRARDEFLELGMGITSANIAANRTARDINTGTNLLDRGMKIYEAGNK